MAKGIATPPPRDYGQEMTDTLRSQIELAPDKYAAEAKYQPLYTQLNLENLNQALTGQSGGRGLLDLYENVISPVLTRAQSADQSQRIAGEMGALEKYGGQVTKTIRDASGNTPLVTELNRQALADLQAGAGLDPSLVNEVQQGVRAGQAARGFGFGAPDAVAEAFARGERGMALRDQRRQFAGQVVGLNQATGGDPLLAILGRPSQTLSASQGFIGQGGGFMPGTQFNPESAYAGDVFNTNYNAQAAANIGAANNRAALTGAAISAAGSAAGAM